MNRGVRNGLYIIFALLLNFINYWLEWMSIFEVLMICCFAMIIVKLTDIDDTLGEK